VADVPNQTATHTQAGEAIFGGFIRDIAELGFLDRSHGQFLSMPTDSLRQGLQELVNPCFGPALEVVLGMDSTLNHRINGKGLWIRKQCRWWFERMMQYRHRYPALLNSLHAALSSCHLVER
jgi:hypothetical protein